MKLHGPELRPTVFISESDTSRHKPTGTETVPRAHQAGLTATTVLRGVGYHGTSSRVHATRLRSLSEDLPDEVVTAETIRAFLPWLSELITESFAIVEEPR